MNANYQPVVHVTFVYDTGSNFYSAPVKRVRNIVISLSVCPREHFWNRWIDLREICYADPLWPWLGPPMAALRYVMYVRFYGWRHVWP